MAQSVEEVVSGVSVLLREIVHDMNNSLFVTKGFLEELQEDVEQKRYLESEYDHENFQDMFKAVSRNVEKLDVLLNKLRKFAKEEVFTKYEVPPPSAK